MALDRSSIDVSILFVFYRPRSRVHRFALQSGTSSDRSHSDAAGLDDGEVTGPIVTRRYQVGQPLSDIARPRHRRAQQDDTARPRERRPLASSPKSLSNVSRIRSSRAAHASISESGHARRCYPGPNDLVPSGLKSGYRRARKILVGEKAHFRLRSGIPSPSSTYRARRQDTR